MGSVPIVLPDEGGPVTPGFSMLANITPGGSGSMFAYWYSVGTILVLFSLGLLKQARLVFETRSLQYLGKISFALYLVHGPLLHCMGFAWQPLIWQKVTGFVTNTSWLIGLLIGWIIMLLVSLAVAHLFWRRVDTVLVEWTRRLENWATVV